MVIKEPIAVREELEAKHGVKTIREIAKMLGIAANTASSALRGEPVIMKTVSTIAAAIDKRASDIAEYVN